MRGFVACSKPLGYATISKVLFLFKQHSPKNKFKPKPVRVLYHKIWMQSSMSAYFVVILSDAVSSRQRILENTEFGCDKCEYGKEKGDDTECDNRHLG